MRNDARPIGEHSPASPVGGSESPPGSRVSAGHDQSSIESERPDSRESVSRGRESHIVHRDSEQDQPREADDSVTPSRDVSPGAKI